VVDEGVDYYYAPTFAAGRVVVAGILDTVLFQMMSNPSIVDMIKMFCGIRSKRSMELDKAMGIESSYFTQIPLPVEFAVSIIIP
jgi:hypothetical protein